MFGLLRKKDPYLNLARGVYAKALLQARVSQLYAEYGVPDTFDGRFDLLLLHVFIVMDAIGYEGQGAEFNQALFDVTFADMDQTLREMGVGDMGIPKRMRKMMKAFNGRMHAYKQAVESDGLVEALKRNLYGDVDAAKAHVLARYVEQNRQMLKEKSFDQLSQGDFEFVISGQALGE